MVEDVPQDFILNPLIFVIYLDNLRNYLNRHIKGIPCANNA